MGILNVNGDKYEAERVEDIPEKIRQLEEMKRGKEDQIVKLQIEIIDIDSDLISLRT